MSPPPSGAAPFSLNNAVRWIFPALICLFLTIAAPVAHPVDPLPEAQQGPLALKYLNAYHDDPRANTAPRKLHVVYFTPADREPPPRYRERLEAILEDIRNFYRDGMERVGLGPETFDLARDNAGRLIIHLVKGSEPDAAYPRSSRDQSTENDAISQRKITRECRTVLEAAGISPDQETVLVFCNLAAWNEADHTFRHHSPFVGFWNQTSGWCFALDSAILEIAALSKREPILHDSEWGDESLGKFNTVFIGGIAHELGHSFALPHCGERWDEKARGKSLMGMGNHTYRDELRGESPGSFLTMASAMKLAGRPLFSKSDKDNALKPRLTVNDWQLSTHLSRPELAGRRAAVRVEGTVQGTPPVYGVIAYFDSRHDGGYQAPTATAVPDAEGHFAIEISDLAPSPDVDLRLEYCHVNGAISEGHATFEVTPQGRVDISRWELIKALAPISKAVLAGDWMASRQELNKLEQSDAPALAKTIARKWAAVSESKPIPAQLSPSIRELPLGDAQPQLAEVGWLKPTFNRIPSDGEITSPLLDAGKIHATGLFAHAPSRYVFDLGGQWRTLQGEAGLHRAHQPYGSVIFIIRADGQEVFRSVVIRGASIANYAVNVTGVKILELIVDDAGDGRSNDWGLWLDPILGRQ